MDKYLIRFLSLLSALLIGLGVVACSDILRSSNAVEKPVNIPTVVANQTSEQATSETTEQQLQPPTAAPSPIIIAGRVTDGQTGHPVPASIQLMNGQSQAAVSITTDENGHFQLQNVEFPLTLRMNVPGYEEWQARYITLSALTGNPVYKLDIALSPNVTAGKLVSAETNTPLAGVAITVNSNGNTQTSTTDDSGAFELFKLLPHDLITVLPPEGYLPQEVVFADEKQLLLSLHPRSMAVTVKDSFSGGPIVGSTVTVDQKISGVTNPQGTVIFSLIPESGQITINHPGYNSRKVDYTGEEAIEVNLSPAGLQAIVRGADTGQPLPQTSIYLGDSYFRTDDNGFFALDSLPVAPTRLMIKAAGYHRTYAQLSQTGIQTYDPPPFAGADGRWLTATPCSQTPQPGGLPCFEVTLQPFQAKAIYVPLHYLRSRERMLEYLDFIAATELNAIVVDVKGDFGFIAWNSDVDLVQQVGADEWFTDSWMPLDEFIAEARARNIYTIARIVVFKDNPLAYGKPDWAAVTEDGSVWLDREELGWANPFREEVWDYNIELAKEVAEFGFDELNFDYIRFPSDGNVGAIVYEEENTLETRTSAIREFMTRLSESLRPYGVFVSADVFGLTLWVVPDSDMRIGQRVIDVAPQVDYLAPMVYPSTFGPGNLGYDNPSDEPYNVVYRSQLEAEKIVPPYVKVRPWLQGYWYSFEEMAQLKQAAIDSTSTGWAWWNAGGKYDENLFQPPEVGP